MVEICCHCYHHINYAEWLTLFVAAIGVVIAWIELQRIATEKKIDFTIRVYNDLFAFLNNPENKTLKNWFYALPESNPTKITINSEDWIKIGQLFEKFEAVAILKKKNAIDYDVYDEIISTYIQEVFAYPESPTAMAYIEHERKEAGEYNMTDIKGLYSGTLRLKKELEENAKE